MKMKAILFAGLLSIRPDAPGRPFLERLNPKRGPRSPAIARNAPMIANHILALVPRAAVFIGSVAYAPIPLCPVRIIWFEISDALHVTSAAADIAVCPLFMSNHGTVCKKGDWLEFRRFCESSCLYPFLPRPNHMLRDQRRTTRGLRRKSCPITAQCAKRGTGSNFAAFAKVRACTPFCPVRIIWFEISDALHY